MTSTIPQHRGLPLVGLAPEMSKRGGLVPILQDIHTEHMQQGLPGLAQINVAGKSILYIGEAPMIAGIFADAKTFDKPKELFAPMGEFTYDHGLIGAQYEQWKRQRQYVRHSFAGRLMQQYAEIINQVASEVLVEALQNAKPNEILDMDYHLANATSTGLFRCMFNVNDRERPISREELDIIVDRLEASYTYGFARFFTPRLMQPLIFTIRRAFNTAMNEVKPILTQTVNRYQTYIEDNEITESWDIISALIIEGMEQAEPGQELSFEEVCGNVLTFVVAGFDTSKSLFKTVMRCLAANPDVYERLQAEIKALPAEDPLTPRAINQLTYLDQVIDEALRYECPVSLVLREAVTATTLAGYDLPQNTLILLAQHIAHHDSRYWDAPEKFLPERFAPGSGQPSHPGAYFPFTDGDRKCIGAAFGKMEVKIGLIHLLRAGLRWEVTNPDAPGAHGPTFQRPLEIRLV